MLNKKIKRFLLSGGLLIATVLVNPISVMPMAAAPVEVQAAEIPTVDPQVDEIVWRYRKTADGTIQKRRWNASRNCWVDPYWINVT